MGHPRVVEVSTNTEQQRDLIPALPVDETSAAVTRREDPCAICRGSEPDRATNIVVTACGHHFHFNCYLKLAVMYGNGQRNHLRRCPVCRAELCLESARFEGQLGLPNADSNPSAGPRTI